MANAIVTSLKESMPVDIKDDFRDETHLDLISEEYEQIYGRESLINKLEEIFKFMPTDTSDHTCLTKIPHIRHIITTNYDTLIEDTFGPDSCYVVRTTDDCVNLPKDKTIVYKIHGDFTKKDNIILTKQDYTNFFSSNNEPLLWKYIQSHILTNDMLFIGYSLEDSNIFTLIQEIRKQVKVDTRKYFLIAPELYHHKIKRLAKTKIKYFNAKAEDLFPVLFETLNKKIKSDYQRKYICLDTFRRYSNQHFLQPIVEEGQKENKIIRFDSTEKTDVKINVSGLSKEVAETIMSQDTTLYNSFLPRTHIPAYMITRDMMKELNISINGLTIANYDDCKNLFISPTVETIKTIILLAVIMILAVSCSSTDPDRVGNMGMFPMRYVPVADIEDLQSGSFEIIGTVTGSGNVSEKNPEDGDTFAYGSLEIMDADRMYFGIDKLNMADPFEVSLANAISELILNAREMGAAFVTFPSYTSQVVDGRVLTTVSAVAVGLVEAPREVVINRSLPASAAL